ncbi:MAG: hypothetical protein LC798_19385 [Chloroflexi bacterium]|nr:hypothetical protein [Chloroflexota bacterium]
MADTLDVLTLDEAKRALNIPAADTTFDVEVASYVTAVSRRLDDLTGPIVVRTITNEPHDGGGTYVFPNHTPVLSVTTVTEWLSGTSQVLTAETTAASTTTDYFLAGVGTHGAHLRRRSSWSDMVFPWGAGNVVLTYVAGRYATTAAVDPKFKQAAAKMLSLMWRGDQGAGSVTFGAPTDEGGTLLGFGFAIPNFVAELLAEERRPPRVA